MKENYYFFTVSAALLAIGAICKVDLLVFVGFTLMLCSFL